jgi:hypothetical protein
MSLIERAFAVGRTLLADDVGGSSVNQALMIGLSSSVLLILVRIGTALAAAH